MGVHGGFYMPSLVYSHATTLNALATRLPIRSRDIAVAERFPFPVAPASSQNMLLEILRTTGCLPVEQVDLMVTSSGSILKKAKMTISSQQDFIAFELNFVLCKSDPPGFQ